MKVILLEENRVTDVADGYARNYLFPQKKAILATPVNLKKFEAKLKAMESFLAQKKKEAEELAKQIEGKSLVIKAETGEEGKLFGSVTVQDIVDEMKKQHGIDLDKKKVNLNDHIKTLGEYSASVKFHHAVIAHIKIVVEKL
ncbi:50S ribosomal protein L9 [candidate division WOR-1 bacterium RIFOXYA2_FULL_36_21]|uniref:Large ribosomal subunit protein bL9 n=1 Tax=candidate division WOR-1 bacterium RIFOXYB2_FULL_36_35 TaxID=1802578 RepID=A0A1F4S0Q5_UNCSA|nr:MAG: 50S ribosomal protein L9 [candidate division WOR-1 bacterium RIFOXYA2_FULL_36_21]OGC14025.1 MAG: 50S ribosomal protein L9 [candidate division WOR-1 bacterium RIFOXYB2_FULL_36_35]OGC14960.1 MAG: 50S ribosomal protein L9 [candidate division WOR-1 bacterium RIFOXYA12_FULL_36_13]